MNITRSLVLTAAFVALVVSACSQPYDVPSPNLAPQFGTTASDSATGLAKHSAGVYVVGNTSGKLHAIPKGGGDVFIRKVDTRSNLVWGRQFGTPARDAATDVATDAQGNAYVLGTTAGRLARSLRGPSDFFLRKYTVSGGVAWTLQFGLETEDVPGGLVVSGSHVYVVGVHGGIGRVFYRFNLATGSTGFKRLFTDSLNGSSTGIASDSSGNLYTASTLNVSCTDQDLYDPTDACARVLIEKFNQAGTRLLSKQLFFDAQGEPIRNSIEGMTSYGNNIYLIVDGFAIPNDDSITRLVQLDTAGVVKLEEPIGTASSNGSQLSQRFNLSVDGTGVYTGTTTSFYRDGDRSIVYSYAKYGVDGKQIWYMGADGRYRDEPDPQPRVYGTLNAILAGGSSGLYVAGSLDQSATDRSAEAFLKRASPTTGAVIWSR